MQCRNLVWHDKRDDTNASPMTTGTSRSLMTKTSQLNRHIRGSIRNIFGVIVSHYLNIQYLFSHFVPYACCNVANYCWAHSVESPSMVDPQWNIWYWGSKWNLHTVCWSAIGCEWGTTSVYFGITYVCFIPSRLPVFAVEPQYLVQYVLFLSKVSFELHIKNLQKISCWFKIWIGFVGPILIKLWTSSIWGFL